ncbi:MAG: GDP-L-fucose synthase [Proteobacteria bacterium]|jgi:GDP-L-fucose synthase|nr:GDP-L-fucose synthase [Pseudomonadota bacterium]
MSANPEKIFIAGHNGMVGSAIQRFLEANSLGQNGSIQLVTRSRAELDLTNQQAVADFFQSEKPDQVYLAAAKVGGILSNNTYPADFIYQNLVIQTNIIHQAYVSRTQKLLFLGSSCIYPRLAEQPMQETALLSGPLEPTNEPYAVAKIAGIKMCESYNRQYGTDFRSAMPTNVYGIGDNFHPENSHVVAALMSRFHQAKVDNQSTVTVWGSGKPRREFINVDDLATAAVFVMNLPKSVHDKSVDQMNAHINIGAGVDVSIAQLAKIISNVVGYQGQVVFDASKPDGAPRKLLDVSKLTQLGWQAAISLEQGLARTYQWYQQQASVRVV